MEIITGRTNEPHILSEDEGALYASIFGPYTYVLPLGNQLSADILDANTIRINSGEFVMNGRFGRIRPGEYETVTIDNGAVGYNRKDAIIIRYKNENGIESFELDVLKGEPVAAPNTPIWPVPAQGNIYDGDTLVETSLYHVLIEGVNITSVTLQPKKITSKLQGAISTDSNDDIQVPNEIVLQNTKRIYGVTTEDPYYHTTQKLLALQPCNENNNCVLGFGGYDKNIGATNIYGNDIKLFSKEGIDIREGELRKNGIPFITYGDYPITYNQDAGTIGTRFLDKTVDIELRGMQPIGAFLWNHSNNYYAMVVPYIAGNTLHIDGYRANSSARSNQSLTVTVLYMAR